MKAVSTLILAFLVGALWTAQAVARDLPIEDFFGSYVGESIVGDDDVGLETRDLAVTIQPWKRKGISGFSIAWTTVRRRPNDTAIKKSYEIDFRTTDRDGIYGSAMKVNFFGKATPLDPLKGDPYVWARIRGETLTVYAMHITDDGSYEMQVYHRTLTERGMDLLFTRWHEGEPVREIRGTLIREKE